MTDNNEKKNARESRYAALHELTHSRAVYVMSFVVPLVIMIAIFIIRDIYPFGDSCYLRSDMYHQYCPFSPSFGVKSVTAEVYIIAGISVWALISWPFSDITCPARPTGLSLFFRRNT